MMNKEEAATKYLSTLKNQLARDQESIQLNAKIGVFLVNEGRVSEAIPYFMKIIELGSQHPETRQALLAYIADVREQLAGEAVSSKYAAVHSTTALGEDSQKELDTLMATVQDNGDRDARLSLSRYRPGKQTIFPPAVKTNFTTPRSHKTVLITRRLGESVQLDDDIRVTVQDVQNRAVRFRIDMPQETLVQQDDSYVDCCHTNRNAVSTSKETLKTFLHRQKSQ